jgi:hypothetical protein
VNSGFRCRVKTQVLGVQSRKVRGQSSEIFGAVHLRRTGGRDRRISQAREFAG